MPHEYDAIISYTRQQGSLVAQRVLDLLQAQGLRVWQDRTHMRGGDDFWQQIETAIEQARYLVMVLTPDAFEDGREVLRREWLTARRRGCRILPVREAGSVDYAASSVPAWLHKLDCYDLDDATDRARLLNDLRTTSQPQPIPHNAPPFPRDFVRREAEMRNVVAALASAATSARVSLTTALRGAGGFGKSTLAQAVCYDDDVLASYTDGVLWLGVGEGKRTPEQLLTSLLSQLGQTPRSTDIDALFGAWKEALRTRHCLVVLDDVWRVSDARALVVDDTPSAFLLTTRIPRVSSAIDAHDCLVDAMTPAQSQRVLAAALGAGAGAGHARRLHALAEKAGNWPVLLGLIAGQLRHVLRRPGASVERTLDEVEVDLRELSLTAFDSRDPGCRSDAVAATVEASLRYLRESDAQAPARYHELAVFPDDLPIPLEVLQDLWGVTRSQARRIAEDFDNAGLAVLDQQRGLIVHDVLLEYIRGRHARGELAALHAGLLGAWPDLHRLPHEYAWRWFGWHCMQAGQAERLEAALLDLDWLAARLVRTDLASLLADCQLHGQAPSTRPRAIVLLEEILEKSAHVLSLAQDQLPLQLFGRARPGMFPELETLTAQATQRIATQRLRSLTQSLHPIGSPLRRTLRGHRSFVLGALALADGRLLSWSLDDTLRLWAASGEPLAVLRGHEDEVIGALALADGRLLSWSGDGTLRLWSSVGEPLAVLKGHRRPVKGALALADGNLLSWSDDTILRLWSADGKPLAELAGHDHDVCGAMALADGRLLSWSLDNSLRLWSATGEALKVLHLHEFAGIGGALALVDGRLLSWSENLTLRLWSAAGEPLGVLRGHEDAVSGALLLADGRLLSWSEDRTLRLWSDAAEPLAVLRGHEGRIQGALALEDGRILSWASDNSLRLWSPGGAPLAVLRGHERMINGALALPDGRLLSWSVDNTLRLWSAAGVPCAVLRGHEEGVDGALALADGRLLSWSQDETLRLWSATGETAAASQAHEGAVNGTLPLADSRLLSWSEDRTLRLWSLAGEPLAVLRGHGDRVTGALALADGRLLSWSDDETLRLWSSTGKPLAVLHGHDDVVNGALALADGRLLSWSWDDSLRLWSAAGKPLAVLQGHASGVGGALARSGSRLLSWSWDGSLRLWSDTGEPLGVVHGHGHGINGVLAMADGRLLSWSWDETLRLWSDAGEALAVMRGHEGGAAGALVLPDGRLLSWSARATLCLWSAAGEPLATLRGHEAGVDGALALADGRLLSWSWDASLRLWSSAGEPLAVLQGHTDRVRGALALADGRLLSWSADNTLRLWSHDGKALGLQYFDAVITAALLLDDGRLCISDALGGMHVIAIEQAPAAAIDLASQGAP